MTDLSPARTDLTIYPDGRCANCGAPLEGTYCSACGQKADDLHRPILTLAGEIAGETLALDARFMSTVWALFRHPGSVARAWIRGRRRLYASPVRLYIAVSLVYFFSIGLAQHGQDSVVIPGTKPPQITIVDNSGKSTLTGWEEALKERVIKSVQQARADPRAFNRAFSELLERLTILMVPVLALLLRLFYWRGMSYLIDALVYSFYLHSGGFLILIAANLIAAVLPAGKSGTVDLFATLAVATFVIASAKAHFQQSTWLTILKWAFMALFYFFVLGLTAAIALVLALIEMAPA